MTTKGTPQENDRIWQDSFRAGRQTIIKAVNMFKKIAPVVVKVIPGNHDTQKAFYLGEALECQYHNDESVTIDNGGSRKYHVFHSNLIGMSHGKHIKPNKVAGIFLDECPKDVGKCKFKYWYLGHIHREKNVEFIYGEDVEGVLVEYLPSLSGHNTWGHDKGYKSVRGCKAYIHNKNRGRTDTYNYNVN